jgi:lipoprotein-releasing system permease protein
MRFLTFIAARHLKARWRQTLMLVLSVAVGVAILTTALSLTNGFEADLVDRILGTTPHINVTDALSGIVRDQADLQKSLLQYPHVTRALPYINGQALLTRSGYSAGVLVRGVDPQQEKTNPDWTKYIQKGDLDPKDGLPGIMLGSELAKKLGVHVGDHMLMVSGLAQRQSVVVSGLYQAGLYEYDAHVAYVQLNVAQRVFGLGNGVTGLAVRLDDVFAAPRVASDMQADVAYSVRPWTVNNSSLLGALALEKRVIFLVTMFIIIVATMGIANTLAMWVLEQSREIAILRAIGASGATMGRLVVIEGGLVGLLGVVVGLLAGMGLSAALATYPLSLPSDVYYISRLPVRMEPLDFVVTAIAAFAVALLACLIPARRALRLDPIEVIRRA